MELLTRCEQPCMCTHVNYIFKYTESGTLLIPSVHVLITQINIGTRNLKFKKELSTHKVCKISRTVYLYKDL